MSYRLRVESVVSSGRLSGALSPGHAGEHGDFDGEVLTVDDKEQAEYLVRTSNNVYFEEDHTEPEPDTDIPRRTIGEEETHDCGVNGCSRTVDTPEQTCWQHPDE